MTQLHLQSLQIPTVRMSETHVQRRSVGKGEISSLEEDKMNQVLHLLSSCQVWNPNEIPGNISQLWLIKTFSNPFISFADIPKLV
jgi:hypothetical protein